MARFAGTYPTRANELRAASAAARAAVEYSAGSAAAGDVAYSAARAAAAILATDAANVATDAAAYAARAAVHAAEILDDIYEFRVFSYANDSAWSAVSCEAAAFSLGLSVFKLSEQPLWPDRYTPNWITELWTRLRAALPLEDGWQVWIDWYEDRLKGVSDPEEVELVYATVPAEKWEEGPAAANAWIKAWLDELARKPWQVEKKPEPQKPLAVPPKLPAAIEPIIRDGKIALPEAPGAADLDGASLGAALDALRAQILELAADLDGEGNIDKRVPVYLRSLADKLPQAQPSQAELFLVAHEQETLQDYGRTVAAEWPALPAGRFLAVTRAFDRTVRQFPQWRAFKQNAAKDQFDDAQREAAPQLAADFAAALREDGAAENVEPQIADTLEEMCRELDAARDKMRDDRLPAAAGTLPEDIVASIGNILKLIAESALHGVKGAAKTAKDAGAGYAKEFADGVVEQAKKEGKKDGPALIKWAKRTLIAAGAGAAAKAAGLGGVIAAMMDKYPQVAEWLRPIIDCLPHL